jgi:hypothetical protein
MAEAAKKSKTEYREVAMKDGRTVQFAGKRKVNKDVLIDESKVILEGDVVQMQAGAISVRMDFDNGETRTVPLALALLPKFAGHGGSQKLGDNLAASASDPLSTDDMVIYTDELAAQIAAGKWGVERAGGTGAVSGASIVVQALVEASGQPVEKVKAFLQAKLDADPDLSRKALYDSFRVRGTKTAAIIERLEADRLAKTAKVDADAATAELMGA